MTVLWLLHETDYDTNAYSAKVFTSEAAARAYVGENSSWIDTWGFDGLEVAGPGDLVCRPVLADRPDAPLADFPEEIQERLRAAKRRAKRRYRRSAAAKAYRAWLAEHPVTVTKSGVRHR